MTDEKLCGARSPIRKFDEGPNNCDRPAGHTGEHSCIPLDLPYNCRHDGYRRNWPQEEQAS